MAFKPGMDYARDVFNDPLKDVRDVTIGTAIKPMQEVKNRVTGNTGQRGNRTQSNQQQQKTPRVSSSNFRDRMRQIKRDANKANNNQPNIAATTPMSEVQPWLDYGRERGEELFSYDPESDRYKNEQGMLERYRGRMNGVSDPEFDLMRERAMRGQQNQLAQNLQLGANQAGRSGVRGAAAMGLQQQTLNQAQQQGRLQENDLAMMQMQRQREAETNFADYLNQLSTAEDMRRMGQFASEYGFGGLGMQDLGQQRGLEAAQNIAGMQSPDLPIDKPWHENMSGGNWWENLQSSVQDRLPTGQNWNDNRTSWGDDARTASNQYLNRIFGGMLNV